MDNSAQRFRSIAERIAGIQEIVVAIKADAQEMQQQALELRAILSKRQAERQAERQSERLPEVPGALGPAPKPKRAKIVWKPC